jgi:group I intron endonuclease
MGKQFGIIYKVINTINGKVYVGQTIKSLEGRRRAHIIEANGKRNNFYFHNAIKRYGLKNFNWETIEFCDSKEEMDEMEFHYIKQYNSKDDGYNLTYGGGGMVGFKFNVEQRLKLSKIRKGRKMPEEARIKLILNHADFSGENNPMYGVTSPMKGKHHTIETKLKISNNLKGKKFTDKHKNKLSLALKESWRRRKNNG